MGETPATAPAEIKDTPDGRQGLPAAAAEVKGKKDSGKKKGRPSKAAVEIEQKREASAKWLADVTVKGFEASCQGLANGYDEFLPAIGLPKSSFAMTEVESKFSRESLEGSINQMPPGALDILGPWAGVALVLVGLSAPRIVMALQLRSAANAAQERRAADSSGDAR